MILSKVLVFGIANLKEKNIDTAIEDSEILLSFVLKKPKEYLYTYPDKKITQRKVNEFKKIIKKRRKHYPVAYLTNKKKFYGLEFYVDNRVLIPRPETELLVEEALKIILKHHSLVSNHYLIADIGTGSGCITVALVTKLKIKKRKSSAMLKIYSPSVNKFKIFSTDISNKSLKVARLNTKQHKVEKQIKFLKGSLLDPLPKKVDLIVANLPYISKQEIKDLPSDVKNYEPVIAYDGGSDGLELYRTMFEQIKNYLKPKAKILLEIGWKQKKIMEKIIEKGLPKAKISIIKDYASLDRIIKIET
jgi:release factor glutamine methyltransferase